MISINRASSNFLTLKIWSDLLQGAADIGNAGVRAHDVANSLTSWATRETADFESSIELWPPSSVCTSRFNTIFMSVMERTREFGIMLAIGYAPRQLFALVMAESFLLANLGLGLCVAMTSPLYWYLSKNGLDLTEAYDSIQKIKEMADILIPLHDLSVGRKKTIP